MTADHRRWLEAMIARLEPRAAARRLEGAGGPATIAGVLERLVAGYRRQLAGELPSPSPAPPRRSPPPIAATQLSMFEIHA